MMTTHFAAKARPAAVAGMFYSAAAPVLTREVADLLARAPAAPAAGAPPKALIVPHAGYMYSGPVAAVAYALLKPLAAQIRRVVLFGPAHRVALRGLALPDATAFVTPLGRIALDTEAMREATALPQVSINAPAHAQEHALEVQLPFLQNVLGDFSLLPFVVGEADPREVAEVIEQFWGGPETLVLISSDLSHYLAYDAARGSDRATAANILELTPLSNPHQACGAVPINGLLEVARRRHLQPRLLDLRNSGDTAGDKSRVVGYAAFAFSETADDL